MGPRHSELFDNLVVGLSGISLIVPARFAFCTERVGTQCALANQRPARSAKASRTGRRSVRSYRCSGRATTALPALGGPSSRPCDGAFVKRALDSCGQAGKGAWGMSWRQEAWKGVEDCDKPGGVVKRALIPGSLNRHALNS